MAGYRKNYNVGDAVVLNTPYFGNGYIPRRYGVISEVVTPGRLYSIALDGYNTRFVDFAPREFRADPYNGRVRVWSTPNIPPTYLQV